MPEPATSDDPAILAALRPIRPAANLPAPATRLVGRAAVCAQLVALLHDPQTRLVALTGIAGVGKTRLALAVAAALAAQDVFADGVFLVALDAPLPPDAAEETLTAAIIGALGLACSGPEPLSAQLRAYLRGRRVLLLLDGAPLRLAAAALTRLLAEAPGLTILAAVRERIGIAGELVRPVGGLLCPAAGAHRPPDAEDAVTLFTEAAQRLNPALALTAELETAAGAICRAVDGLPLAVELAAGWANVLSPAEIAAELAGSLDLLASDRPDLPAHHQSVRAAFNTAWELLGPEQRRVLRQLAVCCGAFDREDATALVGGAPPLLSTLAALVDASLVQREPGAGAARYRLPQIIRQYALEQLRAAGEADDVAARHAQHTLSTVARQLAALRGPQQRAALAAVVARRADLAVAWQHALETGQDTLIAAAAPALFHVYDTQSWFQEGAALFERAQQHLAVGQGADQAAHSIALGIVQARAGWFSFHLGKPNGARAALRASLETLRAADAQAEMIFPLNYLGAVTGYTGDAAEATRLAEQGRALAHALGDRYGEAVACNILGQIAYDRADYTAAREWSTRSLALEEQIGNRWSMAFSLTNLGKAAYAAGALDEATRLLRQSLAIRHEFGDLRGVAICLCRLGDTAAAQDEPLTAADHYEQSYRIFAEIGNQWGMAAALLLLGKLAHAQRAARPATRLLQAALRHALAAQTLPQIRQVLAALGAAAPDNPALRALGQLAARADLNLTDEATARELALASSAAAAALSLTDALAQAREQLARAAAIQARSVGGAGHDALTTRELEVLRLVAEGLSDAQVADRLILSRRTVSTHLGTIYSKLQVSSRTAAVHAARDQGLLG